MTEDKILWKMKFTVEDSKMNTPKTFRTVVLHLRAVMVQSFTPTWWSPNLWPFEILVFTIYYLPKGWGTCNMQMQSKPSEELGLP